LSLDAKDGKGETTSSIGSAAPAPVPSITLGWVVVSSSLLKIVA